MTGYSGRNAGNLIRVDWYPGDYLSDPKVLVMTRLQELAYLRLLQFQARGGPLANVPEALAILARCTPAEFTGEIWPGIRACFVERGGKVWNERMERERELALARVKAASEAGRKGNAVRWGRGGEESPPDRDPIAEGSQPDRNPIAPPDRHPIASSSNSYRGIPPYPPKGKGGYPPTDIEHRGGGEGGSGRGAAGARPNGAPALAAGQGAASGNPDPAPAPRLVVPPFVAAGTGTPEALTKAEVDRRAAELIARSRRAVERRAAGRVRFDADAAPDPGAAATPEEIAARVEAARVFLVNGDPRGADVPPTRADGNPGAPDVGPSGRVSGLRGTPGTAQDVEPAG